MAKEKVEIDKDLAKFLKQAKSKPRNFALLATGTNCQGLIVDKKKIPAGDVTKAKKDLEAKKVYKGLCEGGDGMDMVFKVLEEPSVTVNKLKKFIAENSGMKLKPRFEIVEEIIEVNELGEDGEEESGVEEKAADVPGAPPAPTVVDPAKKQQFRDALVKVVPPVQRTLKSPDVPEDVKTELKELVGQLKSDVAENRFDEAKMSVAQIVPIVKEYAPPAENKAQPKQGGAVDYGKARLAWDSAHKKAKDDFQKLKAAMLAECDSDPEQFGDYREAVLSMDEFLAPFENQLPTLLDQALNATDPAIRDQLHNNAANLIQQNVASLNNSELLRAADDNEVLSVSVFSTLSTTLSALAKVISV